MNGIAEGKPATTRKLEHYFFFRLLSLFFLPSLEWRECWATGKLS